MQEKRKERSNKIEEECIKECSVLTTSGLDARKKRKRETQTQFSTNFFNFSISFFTFFSQQRATRKTEECCAMPCHPPFACHFNCIIKSGSLSIDVLSNTEERTAREMPMRGARRHTWKQKQAANWILNEYVHFTNLILRRCFASWQNAS